MDGWKDRTKNLEKQGLRTCLFYFIKYMGENMIRGEAIECRIERADK